MNLLLPTDWIFSAELPLPSGLDVLILATSEGELGKARLEEASGILGQETAETVARKLGNYELEESREREVALAGVKLGEGGEFPALSPSRWLRHREAGSWSELRAQMIEQGGKPVGLLLDREQRVPFFDFLVRNHVSPDEAIDIERIIVLARHFFFTEPLNVVVRYTGPRFHRS